MLSAFGLQVLGLSIGHLNFIILPWGEFLAGHEFNATLANGTIITVGTVLPTVSQTLMVDWAQFPVLMMIVGAMFVIAGSVYKLRRYWYMSRREDADYLALGTVDEHVQMEQIFSIVNALVLTSMTASILAIIFLHTSTEELCQPPSAIGQVQADRHGAAVIFLFTCSVAGALLSGAVEAKFKHGLDGFLALLGGFVLVVAGCRCLVAGLGQDVGDVATSLGVMLFWAAGKVLTYSGFLRQTPVVVAVIYMELGSAVVFYVFTQRYLPQAQCQRAGTPGLLPCGSCTSLEYSDLETYAPGILNTEVLALSLLLNGLWVRLICEGFGLAGVDSDIAFRFSREDSESDRPVAIALLWSVATTTVAMPLYLAPIWGFLLVFLVPIWGLESYINDRNPFQQLAYFCKWLVHGVSVPRLVYGS